MRLIALLALLGLGACALTEPTAQPRQKRSPIILGTPAPAATPGPLIVEAPGPVENNPAPTTDEDCLETLRGWSYYNATWAGGNCIGSGPCSAVNAGGGFPRGVRVAFDSTAHPKPGQPMPKNCKPSATEWSISPAVRLSTNPSEPFAMQATFTASGRYTLTSTGPEGARAESDVVVIR